MQPQEIEVWYVLPAIRKELAEIFIRKHNLKQKEVAELLDLRESTISQYFSEKRANEIRLDNKTKKEIEKSAEIIIKDKNGLITEIQKICHLIKQRGFLCRVHKRYEKIKNCCICLK